MPQLQYLGLLVQIHKNQNGAISSRLKHLHDNDCFSPTEIELKCT